MSAHVCRPFSSLTTVGGRCRLLWIVSPGLVILGTTVRRQAEAEALLHSPA